MALRYDIDAVIQGIKVSDYAEEREELKTAITKRDGGRTGFLMPAEITEYLSFFLLV